MFHTFLSRRHFHLQTCLVPSEGVPKGTPDFLLVMGGPMSANDPEPWIASEIHFIKTVVDQGIPTVGVCLGAQLLAKALGAEVNPGTKPEISLVPIFLTEEGQSDAVFRTFPTTFDVFQWHGEGVGLPQRTAALASSALYPIQAFRYGLKAYGILFHLELKTSGIEALCRECPDDVQRSGKSPEALLSSATKVLPSLHSLADGLISHLTSS